ncbi:DNA polymerase Y family protein [Nitrospirillum viridazoti]|uniref:Y-family DNA polymerase n=1 Tax=Nitrospirillum viridazoti TaxID=3144925 RepID=UPI0011AC25E7|nr:DNA polymerase Y family protein [Nitrospirillum amazonense]TWB34122.1 protein ImuB [Nitrospirillum amazonense]
MRRILSLWLPTFATDRVARGLTPPLPADDALVTRLSDRGRLTVAAVNAAARAKRLVPGMGLADARALEPQVRVVDADPEGDVAALERLADWARRYTPWTAVDPSDPPGFGPKGLGGGPGLLMDITGCAHLLGGEHELLLDLERRLAKAGFEARAAIADSIGAAWAQARFGAQLVVPPGGAAEALADLPLPALRLGPDLVASLRRVGLRRVGELMRMAQGTAGGAGSKNRAALAARYGALVALRLDQALGWVEEPLSPRRARTRHTARLTVVDPISTPEGLAQAVRHLLGRVAASLTAAGEGARSLELEAWRIDAGHDVPPQVLSVGASRPNRDPAHLWRLLEPRMDQLEPGAGFEIMAISVTHAAPFDGGQAVLSGDGLADLAGLPAAQTGAAAGAGNSLVADPPIAELVDRLGARLGHGRVLRLLPRQSWIPEQAVRAVPAEAQDNSPPAAPPAAAPVAWPADRPRPIRLLPRPEAVEVVAPIPDDPPLLFRWRDQTYRVGRAEGPERLLPEWWEGGERRPNPNPEPRDYYRVEDAEGRRFWLYRLGLYHAGGPPPRWFLHGFFG